MRVFHTIAVVNSILRNYKIIADGIMYDLRIFIAFYLTHFHLCHGNNWHYSLSSMYDLFDVEIDHIKMAETYIQNEYKRLDDIRRYTQ